MEKKELLIANNGLSFNKFEMEIKMDQQEEEMK